jgi:hypothetical protein
MPEAERGTRNVVVGEATVLIFNACVAGAFWAVIGGFLWICLFQVVIPMTAKWNACLLSPEAALWAQTRRAFEARQPSANPVPYWA